MSFPIGRCNSALRSTRRAGATRALTALASILAAGAAAAQSPAFRQLPAGPAVVEQLAAPAQRAPAPESALFPVEAPPVVALIAAERVAPVVAPPDVDLVWETLPDERRALVVALGGWTRNPPTLETKRQRAAIVAAYAARGYAPFWSLDGAWTDAARSAERRLREAQDDGLDLRAYKIPAVGGAPGVEAELALSEAVAAYAAQASGSRVDPQKISRLIGARPALPDAGKTLARVAEAGPRAGDVLRDFNPPHYGYQALRDKLAELRSQRALEEQEPRARVAEAIDGVTHNDAAPAGRRKASADATGRTEAEIVANMERWRWLPRDLGEDRIEVNIPEFELAVVRGGEVTHHTRVIVGKEETPTPIFSNNLQFIIVNPYWNVPQSIITKEMLPKAGGNLSAIEQKGFKVGYSHGKLTVRQPPGEKNALGRIKFMFPNDFSVYLHDTPSRHLFAESHRAFSHGCMRVDEPFALAEAVLGPGSGWSEERVRRLIGGTERYINLSRPLPIHIEYFTAYVDEAGRLQLRGDLYGYSARVRSALGFKG